MRVRIPKPLRTQKAPSDIPAPWLSRGRTRWMVCEDWSVWIDGVEYTVPAGYIFDGSSIPRIVWWLFPPSYAPAWEASCLHDYCYSHLWRRVTKTFADAAFHSIMLANGAQPWIANLFHAAVSRFGKGGW